MRIILKPMGFFILLIVPALAIVTGLVVLRQQRTASAAVPPSVTVVRLAAPDGSGAAASSDAPPVAAIPVRLDPRSPVRNGSFEELEGDKKPAHWNVDMAGGNAVNVSYVESLHPAHSGAYHLTHFGGTSYEVRTTQLISGLKNGTYELSAWTQNNGGRNTSFLVAKNFSQAGGRKDALIPRSEGTWLPVHVHGIPVSNGQCLIGIYTQAEGGKWTLVDDVELVQEG